MKEADHGAFLRLLCLGAERHGEEAAGQATQERSPVHHSIT